MMYKNDISSIVPRPLAINIPKEDVCHLPWHLGRQGLEYFLSQHTAWLIPLDENNYKLDIRGRLLGGGGIEDGNRDAVTISSGSSVSCGSDYGGGSSSGGSDN